MLNEADGYIIGNSLFSVRLTNSFTSDEINIVIDYAKKHSKEIYLSLNKMFYDRDFPVLDDFLTKINLNDLTGIIASDLGLIHFLFSKKLNSKIIWQGETLSTNRFDFNFLEKFNIKGSFVAKEITLEDILDIGKHKKYKLYLLGHGYFNMFYSKRKLISNFNKHYNLDYKGNKYGYHLEEQARIGERYPILEDENGTHVFRSRVTNSFNVLEEIKEDVDYFVIDTLFKDDIYGKNILNLYKNGYEESLVESILKTYDEKWDDGFYTTKTVYLKEDL